MLAAYAMENPVFYKTVSAKTVTLGQRCLRNHNKLLWQVEGADGVKTGFTKAAGRILVSSATREGRRLVAVTIHDPNDWFDHAALLEEGFSRYRVRRIVSRGEFAGVLEVAGSPGGSVQLLVAEDFSYAVAENEKVSLALVGPGFVYAPVAAGADAGFAYVCIDGNAVGKVPLCYGETVEQVKEEEKSFLEKLFGGKDE